MLGPAGFMQAPKSKPTGETEMLTVTPAYGRDYKTAKAAKESWKEGKDWIVQNIMSQYDGKPINKEDADKEGIKVQLRFCQNRKVTTV